MPEEKHSSELDSLASFRYQGMTLEQLLISVALKQDQILVQMVDVNRNIGDLKERKADKTEVTAFETKLTAIEKANELATKDSNTKLDTYKEAVALMMQQRDRDMKSKSDALELQVAKDNTELDDRITETEKFQNRLIGIGMSSGALGSGLTILATYLLSKF